MTALTHLKNLLTWESDSLLFLGTSPFQWSRRVMKAMATSGIQRFIRTFRAVSHCGINILDSEEVSLLVNVVRVFMTHVNQPKFLVENSLFEI